MVRTEHRFKGLEGIDPGNYKKRSKSHLYLFAGIAGIAGSIILIVGVKFFIIFGKALLVFIKEYWIWGILIIFGFILLRKFLSNRRVEVHRESY